MMNSAQERESWLNWQNFERTTYSENFGTECCINSNSHLQPARLAWTRQFPNRHLCSSGWASACPCSPATRWNSVRKSIKIKVLWMETGRVRIEIKIFVMIVWFSNEFAHCSSWIKNNNLVKVPVWPVWRVGAAWAGNRDPHAARARLWSPGRCRSLCDARCPQDSLETQWYQFGWHARYDPNDARTPGVDNWRD